MESEYCKREVVPLTTMVTMECANVGLNKLFKAATVQRMNNCVCCLCSCCCCYNPSPLSFLLPKVKSATPCLQDINPRDYRDGKLELRSSSSKAKVIGTFVSISGAFVVTLYKGLPIVLTPPAPMPAHQPFGSSQSKWIIGGLFLTTEYILVPMWYIVQIMKPG